MDRQFGPYRLVKQIAVGGMAEIHLAKTRGIAGFEKYVALKMIHPNFSSDDQFIQMLIDEAKITVQLQHVNIAQTFDLGRVDETYYITMEFVDGSDLYHLLRRGSEKDLDMPVDVAAYVAKEMATGLDYAHRKRDVSGQPLGIVHRDVSPQNVLISHAGEVKLVDFGIAKATMRARQTAVGVIKGKYYYMSPEQSWGDTVDHRSDVFSAGIVLYEMLTGQMLYLEEDLHKLLDMVRKANIAPPTVLRRDIPPQLERIVMHALQKRPEDRYQTAADMATDLERFLHVYSPVFTAAKIVRFCRGVLEEQEPPPAPAPMDEAAARHPGQNTARVARAQLVRERSEITDENSVIFRLEELARQARSQSFDDDDPMTAPDPLARPARPADMGTTPMGGQADGGEERTVISGPPGFGAAPGTFGGEIQTIDSELLLDGDFEPTMVESAGGSTEEPPTITRGEPMRGRPARGDHEDEETRAELPRGVSGRPALREGPGPRPAAVPHPALQASTPRPAVSELRRGRRSRRTPADGIPAARGGSILSAIVQSAGPAEPAPTRPIRRAGGSSGIPEAIDTGPSAVPVNRDEAPSGPTQPWPGAAPAGQGWGQPGAHPIWGQPGSGMAPAPDLAAERLRGGFPLAAPRTPSPFNPLPGGSAPHSLTRQLMALEVDEIPDAYKIGRPAGPRWLLRGVLAVGLVALGIASALILFKRDQPPVRASIIIESIPSGARVHVDGEIQPETTPTLYKGARPGERHTLELTMPGYQPWRKEVLVREGGGEMSAVAFLKRKTVKLVVHSQPAGAEVWIGGARKGRTPLTLTGLEPDDVRAVEVRRDGKTATRAIDWAEAEEKTITIPLSP